MPVERRLARVRRRAASLPKRWPSNVAGSCSPARSSARARLARRLRRHDAGAVLAHAVDEADRLGQGHRDAGRRALRAADLAALQCRRWCARQLLQGQAAAARFVGALPRRAEPSRQRPAMAGDELARACPGRSTWRSSAWERTATPRRSFPTRPNSATLLDAVDSRRSCCRSMRRSAGEPRLTLTLARDRRGRRRSPAHRGRGEEGGARSRARARALPIAHADHAPVVRGMRAESRSHIYWAP